MTGTTAELSEAGGLGGAPLPAFPHQQSFTGGGDRSADIFESACPRCPASVEERLFSAASTRSCVRGERASVGLC